MVPAGSGKEKMLVPLSRMPLAELMVRPMDICGGDELHAPAICMLLRVLLAAAVGHSFDSKDPTLFDFWKLEIE